MVGCQNDGAFLGTLKIRCHIVIGIQKETTILTTTHMYKFAEESMAAILVSEPIGRVAAPISLHHWFT